MRYILFLIVLFLCINLCNGVSSATPGLVLSCHFDEGNGIGVRDSAISQSSGTIIGGVSWVTGKFGGCLDFDGTGYVSFMSSNSISMTGSMTFIAWLCVSSPTSTQGLRYITKKSVYNGTTGGYELSYVPSTKLLYCSGYGSAQAYSLVANINSGWHCVAIVIKTTKCLFYVDGNNVTDTAHDTITAVTASALPLYIGRYVASAVANWSGKIDEVLIYNRALSLGEIVQIYQSSVKTKKCVNQ